MKPTFKIKDQEYTFGEITIRRYYELNKILQTEAKDKEFDIVEILTGCPKTLLKKLKYQDWLMVWEEAVLQIGALSGTTEVIQPIIEFNGVKYGLPKIEDLTVGEFADLEVFFSLKDSQSRMHEAAAILYRPIVKQKGDLIVLEEYDSDVAKERAQDFLELPVAAVRSANAFFLQSANYSLKSTLDSLSKNQKMDWMSPEDLEQLQNLQLQDPGGDFLIPLLEMTLSGLQEQQSSKYAKLSTGLPTKKVKFKDRILRFKDKLSTK